MGDDHRAAEAAEVPGPDHQAVRGGAHLLARRGGDVDPLVEAAAAGDRIAAGAEAAGQDPALS